MEYSLPDLVYYIILAVCCIFSFIASSATIKGIWWLRLLLVISFLGELGNEYFVPKTGSENIFYYLYIPFEFSMLCFFYRAQQVNKTTKTVIMMLVPGFLLLSVLYSFLFGSIRQMPTLLYNINGIIIIILSAIQLLNMPVDVDVPIMRNPLFWIPAGLMAFYSSIILFNGVYNRMLTYNTMLAENLRTYINITSNYILYMAWTYSFLCSIRIKKYIMQ